MVVAVQNVPSKRNRKKIQVREQQKANMPTRGSSFMKKKNVDITKTLKRTMKLQDVSRRPRGKPNIKLTHLRTSTSHCCKNLLWAMVLSPDAHLAF